MKSGHEKVVRLLLDAGADVDHTDGAKVSLISHAISTGSEAVVVMLLELRPDLDTKDDVGNTVLHHITLSTPVASVRRAVNARAKLDAINQQRNTPLIEAIDAANWDVVRYLIPETAKLSMLDFQGARGTALHWAILKSATDDVEIVKLLVESGADVNLDCGRGALTPLAYACRWLEEKTIRCLVEELNAVVQGSANTLSPIHLASTTCSSEIIELLLQRGADVAAVDDMGRKPLHMACFNSIAAIETLGVSGNDFAARDAFGRLPLHYAALSGQPDLLEHVLNMTEVAGLSIDEPDNDGWTALLWAARATDVFVPVDYGSRGDAVATEMTRLLLGRGANCHARGRVPGDVGGSGVEEWSASDVARYHGALELAAMLEKDDPPRDQHQAAQVRGSGRYVCLRWMLIGIAPPPPPPAPSTTFQVCANF